MVLCPREGQRLKASIRRRFARWRMKVIAVLAICLVIAVTWIRAQNSPPRQFSVDYTQDEFLLDGAPWRYVSGSLHYFRVLRVAWQQRLRAMRAAGLNAVSTYVEWSFHEPSPGVFHFDGERDLVHFIQLAQQEGLLVMLRPGPYICAERDFGGLPPWLMTVNATMGLRSNDARYKHFVARWFGVLMNRIKPLLYGNGGPVIMVQVENEYGSYDACDAKYLAWLRDDLLKYTTDKALLYTTDGAGDNYLKCGKIPGVYATVDFGPVTDPAVSFAPMRRTEPHGPLVNSEFYPGWLTHWEEKWQRVDTEDITNTLDMMLQLNASVNFYVFAGGTNFGFTNGANFDRKYQPTVTSYDYDAPLTEAGDPTDKYLAIRKVIGRYMPLPDLPVPVAAAKGNYGFFDLKYIANVFEPRVLTGLGRPSVNSQDPLTFEQLGQSYGFVLYEAMVPPSVNDPMLLSVPGIRDRAIVALDKAVVGALSRARGITDIPLIATEGQTIQLLVENQGRVNYGGYSMLRDLKGILGSVTLDGTALTGWTMTGLPLSNIDWVQSQPANHSSPITAPVFLRAEFNLKKPVLDSFLDMTGFGKGVVFVNGHNLGRYWPKVGPINTLYVPAGYLVAAPAVNSVVVFELECVPVNPKLHFVTEHKFDTRGSAIKRFA